MIRFVYPEAWLLLVPVGVVLWLWLRGPNGWVTMLRGLLLLLLVTILTHPYRPGQQQGRDLILVLDRSRSMPAAGASQAAELSNALVQKTQPGDRIGLVTFGRNAVLETAPSSSFRYQPPTKTLDVDGTDLAQALRTASSALVPGRPSSLVLLSDGEQTGGENPLLVARELQRQGIRVDVVPFPRKGTHDVSVEDITLPIQVGENEQFQFSTWVRSERAIKAPVRLRREGRVISEQVHPLKPGLNRLQFRDQLKGQGLHTYEVEVIVDHDTIPENNRAHGVTRVAGPSRLLCITPQGRQDRLTRSLQSAGLNLVVGSPAEAPSTLDELDGFRSVVLENVAAHELPPGSMKALQHFVHDVGGGLLLTGGKSAFGVGGYYHSPIEQISPVSFEIRPEQRKFAMAMAIVLDNSGSMSATVAGGVPKMALANQGAIEAVKLLSPADQVAVMSVDSTPDRVIPLTTVTNPSQLTKRIEKISVGSNGIMVEVALHAAAAELNAATAGTKHIVLFADASDAQAPGDYKTFVPLLAKAGITVSVIGMGSPTDHDAALLREIATLGRGRIFFAENPSDIPRVFAQETIQVAHSSWVDEPTTLVPQGELQSVLERSFSFPPVPAYNMAYRKPDAQVGLLTKDEQKAPFVAFWQHGLGRTLTVLGEADGTDSGEWARWVDYGAVFASWARWTAGNEPSDAVFPAMIRRGHEALVSIEVEPGQTTLLDQAKAQVVAPDGSTRELVLTPVSDSRAEARVSLTQPGTYRSSIALDLQGKPQVYRLTPVTLPYSPEYESPLDPQAGETLLKHIAAATQGTFAPTLPQLLQGSRTNQGITYLSPGLAWLALVVFLLEITLRRLGLALPTWRMPAWARRFSTRQPATPTPQRPPTRTETNAPPQPKPPAPPKSTGVGSALERLQKRQ